MHDVTAAEIERALANSLIIIPSIEGASLLERMLPSLNVPEHIVLVLDQGSADGTAATCANAGVQILQLGTPRTYTQCCNIGLEIARQRGSEYLFISNNDVRLISDVTRELLKEMLRDEKLAIVAPSQVMIFETTGERHVAYRVKWSLDKDEFDHDFNCPTGTSSRIEFRTSAS